MFRDMEADQETDGIGGAADAPQTWRSLGSIAAELIEALKKSRAAERDAEAARQSARATGRKGAGVAKDVDITPQPSEGRQ